MDPHLHLRVHTIKIFVRDQDASLRFYVDQLGFSVAYDVKLQSGDRWVAVSPPDGTAVLTLIAPSPDVPEYLLIGQSTGVILLTENVAAAYAEWRKRGVKFSYAPRLRRVNFEARAPQTSAFDAREDTTWGGVFTRFRDIDGNTFELVGFDRITQDLESQRRKAAERVEAERRTAQEIEIAKQVQARLFPQTLPPIRSLDYAGVCIQARQVGGDYYDFLDLGQQRFGLVIGDISGKGIAAALLMANLQANLRSQCAIAFDQPQRLLRAVNQAFFENSADGSYATLFFAEYDNQKRNLRYVNCGHLPALVVRGNGKVERLDSTSTVVGLFEEWDCATADAQLNCGDTFVMYTDGVTESFNDRGEDFGEDRVIDALRRHRELPPRAIVDRIVDEVQRFGTGEQQDDVTLIVAKCRTAGAN